MKLRLHPDRRVLEEGEEVYADLELPAASGGLPYTVINMVSSVDGEVSVSGRASGIGGPEDRGAMRTLRSKVDAVMIGAGTLRAEKLNLGLDDPALPQPLAVVVGGSGPLPLSEHLINRDQKVLVVLPEGATEDDKGIGRGTDADGILYAPRPPSGGLPSSGLDLAWVMGRLKNAYGVERLLVEGGPGLNRGLVSRGLVDELFLTISPVLLGTGAPSILADNAVPSWKRLRLVSVHEAGGHLFLRYRITGRP